jgi:hypothetical protein
MDLAILIGIAVFFGVAALSTVAQRNAPPAAPVIVVRAEQFKERGGEQGDAGFGIFLLFIVIVAAVYLL